MHHDTALLIQLVEQRWQVLETLLSMTMQQSDIIQQEQISELIPHLSKKQVLLQRFAELQEQLRPLVRQPADSRHWENPEQRQQCQQRLDESEQMLAEMIQWEQNCETTLVASRDRLAERMQQSVGSQQAASAYRDSQRPEPVNRLDLSSQN